MILGIDTSLGTAVGFVEPDGEVLSDAVSTDPRGHAEVIGTLLERALADASGAYGAHAQPAASAEAVTAVAAGMGPGPFTGLRVGIAAARAFALGRGVGVIPVASHDGAALSLMLADPFTDLARFAVVTDARRKEFAYTVYDGIDDDGLPITAEGPALARDDALDARLAALGARRVDVTQISGAMIALVAARTVAAGRTPIGPEPLYLRAPDVTMPGARKRVSQ